MKVLTCQRLRLHLPSRCDGTHFAGISLLFSRCCFYLFFYLFFFYLNCRKKGLFLNDSAAYHFAILPQSLHPFHLLFLKTYKGEEKCGMAYTFTHNLYKVHLFCQWVSIRSGFYWVIRLTYRKVIVTLWLLVTDQKKHNDASPLMGLFTPFVSKPWLTHFQWKKTTFLPAPGEEEAGAVYFHRDVFSCFE